MESRTGTTLSTEFSPAWIFENASGSPEWLSRQFNDRLGAHLSARFLRRGVSANMVTMMGLAVHVVTAGMVFALPAESRLAAAIVALIGWQIAYTLDCSDGQVARASARHSPEGAVLDLLADYLSHTLILMVVWLKVAALTDLAADNVSPGLAAFFALSAGGWFAALHNQALAGPARTNARVLERRIGKTKFFKLAYQARHLMDTSVAVSALAIAMALGGYFLLGAFLVASGIRMSFIVARYLGLFLIGERELSLEGDSD
jgi:phosphatidylglycerophosphate synthase